MDRRLGVLSLLCFSMFSMAGCTGKDEGADTGGDTANTTDSGETADTTDTGETADTTDTTDTGDSGTTGSGLVGRIGTATADASSYDGTEEWYLISEDGKGEDVCRIRTTLTNVGAPRTDCADCLWAHDLVVSAPEIIAESGPGCAVFGYDASTIGDLDGTTVSYGYIPEYYGHAQVLAVDDGTRWNVVTFAAWDDATSAFSYDWQDGIQEY